MIDAAVHALALLVEPHRLGMMLVGIGIGLVVGVLPGMGGVVGLSLVLPFLYGMEPYSAMALLIGVGAITNTSDTFPSILMGVPGSGAAQATIMDGYPLAQQGQASFAMSSAFLASAAGGLFGAVVLFAVLPFARPIISAFGSPELFMLAILGLSMVGVLAGDNPLRGVIAALLGLLIGSVGAAPAVPHYRYTFEILYLFDGLSITIVALGLFALPEMLDIVVEKQSLTKVALVNDGKLRALRATIKYRWLILRSSVIGVMIGMIPGLGGSAASWITYGQAIQFSKDSSQFGKGDIRGVLAPESANNATEGGSLVPTLMFGVPGSGSMAVLLAGMVLLGLQPGPSMLTTHLDITLGVIWTLALANIIGALLCFTLARHIAKLTKIPGRRLVPFLLVLMLMAAFQASADWGDIVAVLSVAVVGWIMKHQGWPRPPLLIGYVLSVAVERYLWISSSRFGYSWLTHPGVLAIGFFIAVTFSASVYLKRKGAARA